MEQYRVSSMATGGVGVEFEYRVAAMMLSRLLRQAPPPIGFQLPVCKVALQQRNDGYRFDDIVIFGRRNAAEVCVQIQVKHRIEVTRGDSEFLSLIGTMAEICESRSEAMDSGLMRLGLVARGNERHLKELSALTEWASCRSVESEFDPESCRPFMNDGLVQRYKHVLDAVQRATGMTDRHDVTRLAHRILQYSNIWFARPEPNGADWRAEISELERIAADCGAVGTDILAHLCGMARQFGIHAGVVDGNLLRSELLRQFGVAIPIRDENRRVEKSTKISIKHSGSGPQFTAETQSFNNLRFG